MTAVFLVPILACRNFKEIISSIEISFYKSSSGKTTESNLWLFPTISWLQMQGMGEVVEKNRKGGTHLLILSSRAMWFICSCFHTSTLALV